jgi:hypothetical protein
VACFNQDVEKKVLYVSYKVLYLCPKLTIMKIEIKNVKFSEFASQETNCFTCNIYADGKRIGFARNQGTGGFTYCQPYDEGTLDKFREVEKYCESLPPIVCNGFAQPFEIESNLENIVDDLFEKWLKEKDNKKMQKDFNKGLCLETAHGYDLVPFYKGGVQLTLDKMASEPSFLEYVKTRCQYYKSQGRVILNNNLPFEV